MEKKRYTSYAQIENDLEILKIEKEIHLRKIVLHVEKTRDSFMPSTIIQGFLGSYKSILSNSYGTILKIPIPVFINWFTKRKRGC